MTLAVASGEVVSETVVSEAAVSEAVVIARVVVETVAAARARVEAEMEAAGKASPMVVIAMGVVPPAKERHTKWWEGILRGRPWSVMQAGAGT